MKRLTEDVHKINQEVSEVRSAGNGMQIQFQKVKAEMEQREDQLREVVENIRKYEFNDKDVQSRLALILEELEVRPLQTELVEVKRHVESKMASENALVRGAINKIAGEVKEIKEQGSRVAERNHCFELDAQSKLTKLSS